MKQEDAFLENRETDCRVVTRRSPLATEIFVRKGSNSTNMEWQKCTVELQLAIHALLAFILVCVIWPFWDDAEYEKSLLYIGFGAEALQLLLGASVLCLLPRRSRLLFPYLVLETAICFTLTALAITRINPPPRIDSVVFFACSQAVSATFALGCCMCAWRKTMDTVAPVMSTRNSEFVSTDSSNVSEIA
jgi:hypothetical protein